MKVDFLHDLKNIVKSKLESSGYNLPKNQELNQLILTDLEIEKKSITPQKRNVKISKEIGEHDLAKYEHLINKIENGDDVKPFLSNKIRNKPHSQDSLLNDWGIHHLHLKQERTKELLFVYFDKEDAYFIDIMPHEDSKSEVITWANDRLIKILHDNWPELLEPYKFNSTEQSDKITNNDRRNLRKLNCNSMITTSDGTTYVPPGGGFMASGNIIRAVIQADRIVVIVEEMQKHLKEKLVTKNIASLKLTRLTVNDGYKNYLASVEVIYTNEHQIGSIIVISNNGTITVLPINIYLYPLKDE